MDDQTHQAISLTANFITQAMVMLVKNLTESGALPGGAMEAAIRETLEYPDAERQRLDYRFLELLLMALERKDEPPGPRFAGKLH